MKDLINVSGLLIKRMSGSDTYVARGILKCGYTVTTTVDARQHIRHCLQQEVIDMCNNCIQTHGDCHAGGDCHE